MDESSEEEIFVENIETGEVYRLTFEEREIFYAQEELLARLALKDAHYLKDFITREPELLARLIVLDVV